MKDDLKVVNVVNMVKCFFKARCIQKKNLLLETYGIVMGHVRKQMRSKNNQRYFGVLSICA